MPLEKAGTEIDAEKVGLIMSFIDLRYEPQSLLPPFPVERLNKFEEWLCSYWEMDVSLPLDYCEHVSKFHGGVPLLACFQAPSGRVRKIGRFFNFLEAEDLSPPLTPSWRQWSGEPDIRLDYRVAGFLDYEFWCVRLEDSTLLPFAGLDTLGYNCREMDEMSLLCFDYSLGGEPRVVTWDSPFDPIEEIAPTFSVFLRMLGKCQGANATEKPEKF